jgi:hypothetical protein
MRRKKATPLQSQLSLLPLLFLMIGSKTPPLVGAVSGPGFLARLKAWLVRILSGLGWK